MIPTARATDADVLVIATASIDADTIGALTTQAQEIGLRVRIVPQLHEMIDGVRHTDLREIRPEDLLRRRAVATDLSEISEMLAGGIVAVSGPGGRIGYAVRRQLASVGP